MNLMGHVSIGIDKNFPARFLIPLMNLVDECHFELGSECVDRVRMIKDEKETTTHDRSFKN